MQSELFRERKKLKQGTQIKHGQWACGTLGEVEVLPEKGTFELSPEGHRG